MSQEEFAQAVIRVANIQAKREAAGLLFMRTFKWPAVPNGSEDEKDELRRAKLPEILKKYLKPDGHYTL
jgi:Arc/MetJ family transcription regulator